MRSASRLARSTVTSQLSSCAHMVDKNIPNFGKVELEKDCVAADNGHFEEHDQVFMLLGLLLSVQTRYHTRTHL